MKRLAKIHLIAVLAGALPIAGCSTVHQASVEASASVAQPEPVKTPAGYLYGARDIARYNALIDVYGNAKYEDGAPVFVPSKHRNDGVTDLGAGQYLMTFAARQDFAQLRGMQKMAFPVQK